LQPAVSCSRTVRGTQPEPTMKLLRLQTLMWLTGLLAVASAVLLATSDWL
jgi:hypothetical protein